MATQAHGIAASAFYLPQVGCKRVRAVVADDIPGMRAVIIGALEHGGCVARVETADNGLMAVEIAEALLPDLVVLRRKHAADDGT